MVWARILLLFGCFASGPPKALDARDLAASSVLEALCRFCCWRLLPLVTNFSAFRRQRFGIFSGCCFAWFGHESCCCSAVSQAVRQRLWTLETCRVERSGRVVLFLLLETFAFSAFRRQRFGIFSGCCFAWFGHESCCCSAVSQAVRQRLWTLETCRVERSGRVVLFLLLETFAFSD